MKLGYIDGMISYPPSLSGCTHTYQISKGLAERGVGVFKYYGNDPSPYIQNIRKRNILKYLFEMDAYYIRIEGRFHNEDFTKWKKYHLLRKPIVWEMNAPIEEKLWRQTNSEEEVSAWNQKRRSLAKYVTGATAVSNAMVRYCQEFLGIKNTIHVPNGSDPVLFSPDKKNPQLFEQYNGHFKIIWAGASKYSWMNFDLMVELANAFKKRKKDVVFFLLADQKDITFELPENVIVLGQVPYLDLPPYLASCDMGLALYDDLPWEYGFLFSPLKLYDYMASGLVVLGSELGQIKEVIRDGENGYFYPGSIEKTVSLVERLMKDQKEKDRVSQNARKTVCDYYNWQRAVDQTYDFLKEITGKA